MNNAPERFTALDMLHKLMGGLTGVHIAIAEVISALDLDEKVPDEIHKRLASGSIGKAVSGKLPDHERNIVISGIEESLRNILLRVSEKG